VRVIVRRANSLSSFEASAAADESSGQKMLKTSKTKECTKRAKKQRVHKEVRVFPTNHFSSLPVEFFVKFT